MQTKDHLLKIGYLGWEKGGIQGPYGVVQMIYDVVRKNGFFSSNTVVTKQVEISSRTDVDVSACKLRDSNETKIIESEIPVCFSNFFIFNKNSTAG